MMKDSINNKNDNLISIIMPVYNAEKYLPRSIGSVVNQSYKNWEFLIVDDGSNDRSDEIVLSWMEKDPRIRLIQNQHGGTAIARNTALDQAKGDYIAFLDADDAYHKDFLYRMLSVILQEDADISLCATIRGTDAEEFLNSKKDPVFRLMKPLDVFKEMYGGNWLNSIVPYTKIYKRYIFDEIRFPEGMFFEDAATMHLTIYKSAKVAVTEEQLYFYNITPNSSSVTKRSVELLDRERALRSHWQFYEREGRGDLAKFAIPFYLTELIKIHFRIGLSDRPGDQDIIEGKFKEIYRRYKDKVAFTDEQKEQIQAFLHPVIYDIKTMIRKDGLLRTGLGFVKRKMRKYE